MKCVKTHIRNRKLKITFLGVLDVRSIATVQATIIQALERPFDKVVIELGNYEKCDFSFIQLLLALRRHLNDKKLDATYNLHFSAEDHHLLTKLSMINILQT